MKTRKYRIQQKAYRDAVVELPIGVSDEHDLSDYLDHVQEEWEADDYDIIAVDNDESANYTIDDWLDYADQYRYDVVNIQ